MNRTRLTALAALTATLALGIALGFVAAGSVLRERRPPAQPGGPAPAGFADLVRDAVQPRDEAQWAALLPEVNATDERNRATVAAAQESLAAHLEEMTSRLDTLLTADQRERLAEFARGVRRPGAPAPGLGTGRPPRSGPGGGPPGPPPPR